MKEKARKRRQGAEQMLSVLGKELYLVGLCAVQETTGIDLHKQPKKQKHPWQKKWGEK